MHSNYFPERSDVPESRDRVIDFTGNGAGVPTANQAAGATVTRAGAGDYKVTFKENPGKFVGLLSAEFRSTTMTDLAGFSVVAKTYDATNFVVEFTVFNSSFAAADLTSAQSLTIVVKFKVTSVSG